MDIVVEGNRLKFGQNPDLAAILLATGDATVAECSPTDRVWGIGWAMGSPQIQDPSQWRGQNLLGVALMQVRSELRAAAGPSSASETLAAVKPGGESGPERPPGLDGSSAQG
jgi:hypothetical protein